ncbi:MAG TPA: hypothetical protein PKL83_02400, partial [bacterium]|nr:hypothetical protein [bacterium]
LYQPLLQYLQLDIGYFGFVHAAVAGSQVIVLLVYHRIEQLLGTKKKYLLFTALVSGIGFIGIGLLPSVALVITITLLVSGFGLSRIDVMRNYMQAHIPSAERATVLSSLGMVRRLGMAVLNPIIGLCMDASLQGTAVGIGMVIILLAGMSRVQEEWLVG